MRNNYQSQPQNFMLRELREKSGLTREQLAVALNLSTSTLRRWEVEGKTPALTIDEWLALCKSLHLRFTELPAYFSTFVTQNADNN